MIAFNAHDAGGGDAQARVAKIAHADQVRGDESIFESDKCVESGLRAREHIFWIEEGCERRRFVRDGLLESVVGHFFLKSAEEIALIVIGKAAEKRCGVNDVGVSSDSEGFGDFRRDKDIDVFVAEFFVVVAIVVVIVVARGQAAGCGFCGSDVE